MLTDGLAGAEDRMIGIVGLYQKSVRERCFPLHLLEKGLKVKIEDACSKRPNIFMKRRKYWSEIKYHKGILCSLQGPINLIF